MISFVITGVLCAFVALCYAELAAMLPVSGSAYSYSYASMGELVAWIMGLLLVLEYGLAAATVAVGWSGYVVSLLHDIGINIPPELTAAPGVEVKEGGAVVAHGVVNVPAILAIAAVTALLVVGISESATVNNIVVVIKLVGRHRLHRHRRVLRRPVQLAPADPRRRCRRRPRAPSAASGPTSGARWWT